MADEHTEAEGQGSESESGSESSREARPTREQQHVRDRAAFLAEAGDDDAAGADEAAKAKVKKPAPVDEDDDLGDDLDDDEDLDDEVAESEDDDDAEDDDESDDADDVDELAAKAKADPELKKRLDAVRKTEQRGRAALARDRETFDRERADWQAQAKQILESHQRFEKLSARAKYDPTGVLLALGLTEDDLEHAGKQVYARSKSASVKPEHRDAADREARAREHADELATLRREQDELKKTIAERDRLASADAQIETMIARASRVAKTAEDAPLTKQYLAANPKKARAELEKVAARLARKLGALPSPRQVVRAHEKQRLRELGDMGVKLDTPSQKAAAARIDTKLAVPPKGKPIAKPVPKVDDKPAERINGAGIKLPSKADLLAEEWDDAS